MQLPFTFVAVQVTDAKLGSDEGKERTEQTAAVGFGACSGEGKERVKQTAVVACGACMGIVSKTCKRPSN